MSPLKVFSIMAISVIIVIGIWFTVFVRESEKLSSDSQIYCEQDGKDQTANGIGKNIGDKQSDHL